ncbi:hypothetical protein ACVIWV_007105 [Bradyrhizobium diazoefficiens]
MPPEKEGPGAGDVGGSYNTGASIAIKSQALSYVKPHFFGELSNKDWKNGDADSRRGRRLSRKQGRRLERELRNLVKHDRCSRCGVEFGNRQLTYFGTTPDGRAAVTGACCRQQLGVVGFGPFLLDPWELDDREWFKAHPDRSHRLRPIFDDECLPAPTLHRTGYQFLMMFRRMKPGVHERGLIYGRAEDFPDVDVILRAVLDLRRARPNGKGIDMHDVARLVSKYTGIFGDPS